MEKEFCEQCYHLHNNPCNGSFLGEEPPVGKFHHCGIGWVKPHLLSKVSFPKSESLYNKMKLTTD
jgi:hypothetical protein